MEKGEQEKVSDDFKRLPLIVAGCLFLSRALQRAWKRQKEKAPFYLNKTGTQKLFKQILFV